MAEALLAVQESSLLAGEFCNNNKAEQRFFES